MNLTQSINIAKKPIAAQKHYVTIIDKNVQPFQLCDMDSGVIREARDT